MAQTLTVTPNPVVPSGTINIHGTGFGKSSITMTLDGTTYVSKFRPRSDGTFDIGATVSATVGTYSLQAIVGSKTVATASIIVKIASTLTISAVAVTNITSTGATVSWTVSDFATGQVQYGTTTTYGQTTTLEPSFTYKAHTQTISGLVAGTLYHFKCLSQDQSGTKAVSADGTFTTLTVGSVPGAPTVTAIAKDKEVDLGWV